MSAKRSKYGRNEEWSKPGPPCSSSRVGFATIRSSVGGERGADHVEEQPDPGLDLDAHGATVAPGSGTCRPCGQNTSAASRRARRHARRHSARRRVAVGEEPAREHAAGERRAGLVVVGGRGSEPGRGTDGVVVLTEHVLEIADALGEAGRRDRGEIGAIASSA